MQQVLEGLDGDTVSTIVYDTCNILLIFLLYVLKLPSCSLQIGVEPRNSSSCANLIGPAFPLDSGTQYITSSEQLLRHSQNETISEALPMQREPPLLWHAFSYSKCNDIGVLLIIESFSTLCTDYHRGSTPQEMAMASQCMPFYALGVSSLINNYWSHTQQSLKG